MRLYVVRHGQTSWNVDGRAQGHTDIPLSPVGLEQAEAVGEAFRGIQVDRILASDLSRALQTARPIQQATGAPLEQHKALRERCFGDWEGDPFTEVSARSIEAGLTSDLSLLEVRPPNGESFVDLWNRVTPILEEIESTEETLAIVSHGGTCSILLARIFRGTVESSKSFRFGNTAVTEIERRADGFYVLVRYADASHLNNPVLAHGRR